MVGGKREGSGRKPGSRNKRTEEQIQAVEASGLTPLEFMLSTLRNGELDLAVRMDAAFKAAPYVHPKLSSTESKNENSHTFEGLEWSVLGKAKADRS